MKNSPSFEGPAGQWLDRQPNYLRSLNALVKKTFLTKIRHWAAIIEILGAFLIFNLIWPVHVYARYSYPGDIDPDVNESVILDNDLLTFFGSLSKPSIVMMPNTSKMHDLVDPLIELLEQNLTVEEAWVDNLDDMYDFIYARDTNGLGIYWKNSEDEDSWENPQIEIFHQSFATTPTAGMFRLFKTIAATQTANMKLLTSQVYQQMYATPQRTSIFDIRLIVGFFALMPVMFATMDDVQTVLDEKDNKIAALTFLMGCPESAYWLTNILTSFINSILPHVFMAFMWCYVYLMNGTDVTLFIVVSIIFIPAHILFQLFITTFMKHSRNGRALMVTTCVFIFFFSFLHVYVTLDPNNTSDALKQILQIIPFNSYQLILMTMYTQVRESLTPISWSTMNANETFDVWWGILWLIADNFIYLFLFILFNATNSREYGTPAIPWRQIFSAKAWKRLFGIKDTTNLQLNTTVDINAIEVKDLSKVYNGYKKVYALTDVNFNIKPGEVIVVIGPNGAGKSTLMNTLSGTILPSTGTLRLFGGEETAQFREIQDVLGICFQENVLFDKLSVKEHFLLFGAFRGISQSDLNSSIEFFSNTLQLTAMLDNRAGDLSGGQKRKLCIALTLLGNPPIVIMDEPTAGVDVQARQLIWKTISALKNTTAIITSHALEEAEAVSSRLFIVAGGHLVFQGTSTELRKEYKCGYLLRIDNANPIIMNNICELAKKYVEDARIPEDRPDVVAMSVSHNVPAFLQELKSRQEEIGFSHYSFSVEQLEDMLMKLIQTGESQIETH